MGTVLYESRDRFSHKIVLHVGTVDGVRAGNPVIDDVGVVGQVTRVFTNTAEVTLLTDKDQSIPIQIVRNGLRGIAFGGADPGTLDLRFMAANGGISRIFWPKLRSTAHVTSASPAASHSRKNVASHC